MLIFLFLNISNYLIGYIKSSSDIGYGIIILKLTLMRITSLQKSLLLLSIIITYNVAGQIIYQPDICNELSFNTDTIKICPGSRTQITLNGNVNNTKWFGPDLTYDSLAPNVIEVYPQQTTTYIVRNQKNDNNLIQNSDFELGNTNFTSEYVLHCPVAPGGMLNQGAYCVRNNPNTLNQFFQSCGDHTSGNGNMFVTDGSPVPNQKVWCQNINVQQNRSYEFSSWITSVLGVNPPILQFSINDVQLDNPFQLNNNTCEWQEFSSVWNSGINTSAEICIVNQNTNGNGNDFALDDIFFRTICEEYDTIVVEVVNIPKPNIGNDTTICSDTTINLSTENIYSSYNWKPNNENTSNIVVRNSGQYILDVENSIGCKSSDTINIETYKPIIDMFYSKSLNCIDEQVNFINNSPGQNISCNWDFGDGNTSNNCSPNHSYQNPGNYDISFEITDPSGCRKDTTYNSLINISPKIDASISTINNTDCSGENIPCDYVGPSVLINEISISPTVNDGSLFTGINYVSQNYGEGEWIELYNPNNCDPVDISGYILGTYNSGGPALQMGYSLPNNTIIPPNGFLVLRGRRTTPPPAGVIDIVVNDLNGNMCLGAGNTGRFWFANSGSWFAFYDRNGVPQDMISWGNPLANDLNQSPCIPTNNSLNPTVVNLPSYNASGIGTRLGNPIVGNTYVRIPDGGNWANNTVNENTSYGSCNVPGNCVNGVPQSTCNGSATVTVNFGTGPFTYQWDDILEQTTQTAINLCSGLYNVEITDANGCDTTLIVEIFDDYFEISQVDIVQPNCPGDFGSIDVSLDLNRNYTYNWDPNVSNNGSATNLSEGNYKVTISDGFCERDTTVEIIVQHPIPEIIFDSDIKNGCEPTTINFTNNSTGVSQSTSQCEWDFGDGTTSNICEPSHIYDQAGLYSVSLKITSEFGCENDSIFTDMIEIYSNPIVKLQNDTTICKGDTITLKSNNKFDQYLWSPNNLTSDTINVFNAGEYILKVTDSNNCINSDTFNLAIDTIPVINLGNDTSICINEFIQFQFDNIYSNYDWNDHLNTQYNNSNSITVNDSSFYALSVTDGNGCIGYDTIVLTIDTLPLPNLGKDTSICFGESVEIGIDNIYTTYDWISNNTNPSNTNIVTIQLEDDYIIKVTDGNGCIGNDTINLSLYNLPQFSIGNDTAICIGDTITLRSNNSFDQYLWSPGNLALDTINVFNAGEYILNVTDSNNCINSDTFNLAIDTIPVINLGNDTSICINESIQFQVDNIYSNYDWNDHLNTQYNNSNSITVNDSSFYALSVTDGYGCIGYDTIVLTIDTLPLPNLGNDTNICFGESVEIGIDNIYTTYDWISNNTNPSNTNKVNVKLEDDYIIKVTDGNGCIGNDTIKLSLYILPDLSIGNDTIICKNDSIIITVQSNSTINEYLWNTNETSRNIKATRGEYFVKITDENNCINKDTIIIDFENQYLNIQQNYYGCIDELVTISPDSIFNVDYLRWNNTVNSNSLTTTAEGNQYLRGESLKGCLIFDTTNIIRIEYPALSFIGDTNACIGDQIDIEISTNANEILWEYNDNNTSLITVSDSGKYYVTVSNQINNTICSVTKSRTAIFHDYPLLKTNPKVISCFEYQDTLLIKTNTNAVFYEWISGRTGTQNNYLVNEPGVYNVIMYNYPSCSVNQDIAVEELCPVRLFIPNAFTPNDDGLNDFFKAIIVNQTNFEMYIYNRWGQLIHTSTDPFVGWDGTYMGNKVLEDVYVWKINYSGYNNENSIINKSIEGIVTVIY